MTSPAMRRALLALERAPGGRLSIPEFYAAMRLRPPRKRHVVFIRALDEGVIVSVEEETTYRRWLVLTDAGRDLLTKLRAQEQQT